MRLILICSLLCGLPLSSAAQGLPVALTCQLTVMCPHTGACRDLAQTIEIRETADGWNVDWVGTELPSDYELIADMTPVDGAVEEARVRSLIHRDTATQTMQMLTFETGGNVVVTTHQPHAGMQVVTGLGACEAS